MARRCHQAVHDHRPSGRTDRHGRHSTGQLGIDHSDFRFSRDILAKPYEPWAYHSFTNGMLFFDTDGHTEFDMVSSQVVDGTPERINRAKALAQTYYDHLDKI